MVFYSIEATVASYEELVGRDKKTFPQEKLARGIPVLWLLSNEDVEPPWGKVARITA